MRQGYKQLAVSQFHNRLGLQNCGRSSGIREGKERVTGKSRREQMAARQIKTEASDKQTQEGVRGHWMV